MSVKKNIVSIHYLPTHGTYTLMKRAGKCKGLREDKKIEQEETYTMESVEGMTQEKRNRERELKKRKENNVLKCTN